jgi:hypothetical protein
MASHDPWGHDFYKLEFLKLSCKFQIFWCSGSSEIDFVKHIYYINTSKNVSPLVVPSNPRGP